MRSIFTAARGLCAALATGLAAAATPPDPLDPAAATLPLQPVSAFAGYRGFDDAGAKSWREANRRTAEAGGWRAYAREAGAPAAEAAVAPTSGSGR